ncbi:MAG TPA: hypothetical protein VNM87_00080, partial [Candidatus Udaeobacter sp.]|nr:hypothetical protein [Candidatus Udaeobacter sp.]
ALLAADQGDPERAAFLLGAADAAGAASPEGRKPSTERDEAERLSQAALAAETWAAALERGRQAALESVIADPFGS